MATPNYAGATWNPWESTVPLEIDGDYQIASRGAAQINYVVLHTTEGNSAYDAVSHWAKDADAAAHYIVDGGTVYQVVSDKNIAYHATNFQYNAASIGIEIVGFAGNQSTVSELELQTVADLVRWLCSTSLLSGVFRTNRSEVSDL
ncbi:MAG: N-acetylmuramoyl-L-alanine amidase [Acetobacteraceae bacterium]|nr:N-acetylmuramoyl-L-alanine amidase [Acetobacteraceae bacterium]